MCPIKVCIFRDFRPIFDTFCPLLGALGMALLLLSRPSQALPSPLQNSTLCKETVEGNQPPSLDRLIRLTAYWIGKQVDGKKVQLFADVLNRNPQPINPFDQGIDREDVQLSSAFDLLFDAISQEDWTQYVSSVQNYLQKDKSSRAQIEQIDEDTRGSAGLSLKSRTDIEPPHHEVDPNIITLKNGQSYSYVQTQGSDQSRNSELLFYSTDQNNFQMDLVSKFSMADLFPPGIDIDRADSYELVSIPVPLDDQRILVAGKILMVDQYGYEVPQKIHILSEVNIITGEIRSLKSTFSTENQVYLNFYVNNDEEIYISTVTPAPEKEHKTINFQKLNIKTGEITLLESYKIRFINENFRVSVQIIQKENGDFLWVASNRFSETFVFTMDHKTEEFPSPPAVLHIKDTMSVDLPVIHQISGEKWLFAIGANKYIQFYIFDSKEGEYHKISEEYVNNSNSGNHTFLETESGNLYFITGTGVFLEEELKIFKFDLDKQTMEKVASNPIERKVNQKIAYYQGSKGRILLISIEDDGNITIWDFDDQSHQLIPIQKNKNPDSVIGKLIFNGSKILIPATYEGKELRLYNVSTGNLK